MCTSAAPSRRALRAASIATLPPPITTTRLPARSAGVPSLMSRRKESALETPASSSPGTRSAGRGRCAGGDEHGVVAVAPERVEVVDPRRGRDLDAGVGDVRDVALDHLRRQPVGRDREPERATGDGRRLEDLHAVALARQQPRSGQARRARADDRDPLAVRVRQLERRRLGERVVTVGDEALQPPDRQRALEAAARALRLARRVAGAAEAADERCRLEDEVERLLVLAAAHERDVAVRLDPGGAGERAGRRAGSLDQRLLRDRLREGDVGRPPRDEVAVELIGHRDRAGQLALPAAGAERLVDEARLAMDGRMEAAVPVALRSRRPRSR